MGLRHRELEHIGGLNICGFLKYRHELRQIVELGKSRFGAVARAFRGKLDGCHRLAEGGLYHAEVSPVRSAAQE